MTMAGSSSKVSCDQCTKSFSSESHLERHKISHRGIRMKVCPRCNKGFGRQDVLKKHIQNVHKDQLPKVSRRKSCSQCASLRVKCSGGLQCSNCAKNGVCCEPSPMTFFKLVGGSGISPQSSPHESFSDAISTEKTEERKTADFTSDIVLSSLFLQEEFMDWQTLNALNSSPLEMPETCEIDNTLTLSPWSTTVMGVDDAKGPTEERWSSDTAELKSDGDNRTSESLPVSKPNQLTAHISESAESPKVLIDTSMFAHADVCQRLELNCRTLETCIRMYIKFFQPFVPILPRSFFSSHTTSDILLAAVVSIGAGFSKLENAHSFADSTSRLVTEKQTWLQNHDHLSLRSEYCIAAMTLRAIYLFGSGQYGLFEFADNDRSTILRFAKQINLFQASWTMSSQHSVSLKTLWQDWKKYEQRKRLAWLIFGHDYSLAMVTHTRAYIKLEDLQISLPCDDSCFDATTEQAWAASCFNGKEESIVGYSFTKVIQELFASPIPPNYLPVYTRKVITTLLDRMLLDICEMEIIPFPKATLGQNNELMKSKILAALDAIVDSYSNDSGSYIVDGGSIAFSSIIAHHAHVHSYPLLKKISNITKFTGYESRRLKECEVINDFATDAEKARTVAWHALQVLIIVRDYPVHVPCMAHRAFNAALYLWGFARYAKHEIRMDESTARIDTLPWRDAKPVKWIKQGGFGYFESVSDGVIPLAGRDGALAVLRQCMVSLQRMWVWRLADKFKGMLIDLIKPFEIKEYTEYW